MALDRGPIVCAVLCVIGLAGCHEEATSNGAAKTELLITVPSDAETLVVEELPWPVTVRTQGSLVADEQSIVSAKVTGRVDETTVDFGDVVKENQALARLEVSDFELKIRQAEALLAEACAELGLEPTDSTQVVNAADVPSVAVEQAIWDEAVEALNRLERLQRTNSVSESEFRKQKALARVAKARYDAAVQSVDSQRALIKSRRVELAIAQQSMDDATIRAPFDGVIQRRHIAAGTFVQAGTPLFTLVRVNPLRFQGRIPERKATSVQIGKKITILIEGSDEELETVVERVSPSLDLASRSLQIEAEVSNADGGYRSGLFAQGIIVVDPNATTIAIPRAALGDFAGVYKVWLVEGQSLISRQVSLGRESGDLIELESGVAQGDVILADYFVGDAARRQAGKPASQDPTKAGH